MREIIITDTLNTPGAFSVSAFLWLSVPGKRGIVGQQQSRMPVASTTRPWGITPEEQALFTKGVVQEVPTIAGPFSTGTDKSAVLSALQVAHDAAQAQLDATAAGALDIVGASWDGATWAGQDGKPLP